MLFPLFATCVVDTIGKFATSIKTPAKPVAKFAFDVIFGA
jgi:hypothetical protein